MRSVGLPENIESSAMYTKNLSINSAGTEPRENQ